MKTDVSIDGVVDEGFEGIRDVFVENFVERGEIGAAVAVWLDGEPVVDLWGGVTIRDGEPDGPWKRDTLVCMASVNKGLTAICGHRLVDQGKLDYDKPVAHYWPEFTQAGKEEVTVRQLIGGWAALIYPDEVPDGKAFEWATMVEGLARTEPAWPVGTRWAYHSSTYGHLVGELVHRASDLMPDEYFRAEIAEPLEIDYWFRLPDTEGDRVSEWSHSPGELETEMDGASVEGISRQWRILPSADRIPDIIGVMNDSRYRHELMPSAWGKGNARAVGKLFAALSLGGSLDGHTVVSPDILAQATAPQWEGTDSPDVDLEIRSAMGLNLNTPGRFPMGPNPEAFGTNGVGGNVAFADPDTHLGFGYCANTVAAVAHTPESCEALIDAVYAAI